MRISDWSSDVCSSDLRAYDVVGRSHPLTIVGRQNIIPVDHPDMIAVNAILGLELPIALISICLRPGDDRGLDVGILIYQEVDERFRLAGMIRKRRQVGAQAGRNDTELRLTHRGPL